MGKKQKCPEFENHERWLVSFADMMTLLFAVFVVLYALKTGGNEENEAQVEQAASSIRESFNEVYEDIPEHRRLGPSEDGFGIFEHMQGDQISPPVIDRYPGSDRFLRLLDNEMQRLNKQVELRLYGDRKFRDLSGKGDERVISVHRDDKGVQVRLLAAHFFPSGSYKLSKKTYAELLEVADIVKQLGRPVTIEGHTDSLPVAGGLNNWDLSSLRATAVVRFFIEQANFPPTSIGGTGYGDSRPIASNATESSRSLNRRIEIRVHYDND